jgi:N-acetylglutamate synthase-like GNAT family acetyltransferase
VTEITDRWHSLESLARGLDRRDHAFLVAEARGAIEGTVSATFDGAELVVLNRLYVRPARQKAGFGTALLEAAIAQFPQARLMRLEVDRGNRTGKAFYARHGFTESAERPRIDDIGEPVLWEKAIGEARALPTLTLRPVRDGDGQDLFGLLALCFAEYPGCFVDPHEDLPDLLRPAAVIAAKGGRFWVVEDGKGRVGACVSVDFPQGEIAELHRVYVRPDLRRRGLAERLVKLAEDEARARGAKSIFFWSDTRFETAHRFYGRLSYRRSGKERDLGDISKSREYHFEKAL